MVKNIDYGKLMHKALRRVMAEVLTDVAQNGLPGNHHFFISFASQHPDLDVPEWLLSQYPDEMTIVIQNWFENLEVHEDRFEITLSFSNQPVHLTIPFDAVLTFVDPSVEFGLRFDAQEELDPEEEIELPEEPEKPDTTSEVVKLDAFRK